MLLFIVCIIFAAAQGKNLSPKIAGGAVVTTPATNNKPSGFEFIASIQYNGKHFCTGTIFSEYILTAAHCIYGLNYRMLTYTNGDLELTGSAGKPVLMAIPHPLFNKRRGFDYDIAVLKVALTGITTSLIIGSSLPPNDLLTFGWGPAGNATDTYGTLRQGQATFIPPETCRNLLGGTYNRILCTNGGGGCYSDDGGPLLDKDKKILYGIFSWSSGCVSNSIPQVYTDLRAYEDFLSMFS